MAKINWAKVLDIAGTMTVVAVSILGLLTILTLQGHDILPGFKENNLTREPPWTYPGNNSVPWNDFNYSWNHSQEVR